MNANFEIEFEILNKYIYKDPKNQNKLFNCQMFYFKDKIFIIGELKN
jgi:hypothetical protein